MWWLPPEVMGYSYPSRYWQSDGLRKLANSTFVHLQHGYGRVQAIRNWALRHATFTSNSSTSNRSAVDTLIERVGICHDFSHLIIALCRALNIPARFTTVTDLGAEFNLGPPNFLARV